mgnify:FL=1
MPQHSRRKDFKRRPPLSNLNSNMKDDSSQLNKTRSVNQEIVEFTFDSETISAISGQTVGAAILQSGKKALRKTRFDKKPRGMFCGIGICFDCLVKINGVSNQRACLVPVQSQMNVQTQDGANL